jgi:hypothetical protein
LVFAWATLSRVDLGATGASLGRAAPLGLCLVFFFAWLEIAIRAWRWRFLLSALGPVGYGHALAYTCVGYFANTLLPMRLGDVARAYLAATALRLPRLSTLGSVVTERLADGLTILALATALGFVVVNSWIVANAELLLAVAVAGVIASIVLAGLFFGRSKITRAFLPRQAHDFVARVLQGSLAVRPPRLWSPLSLPTLAQSAPWSRWRGPWGFI